MDVDYAVELGRAAVMLCLTVGAPILVVGLLVGLLTSVLQAVTQVQDQTLSFVPKIAAMIITVLYLLPWAIHLMVEYSTNLFHNIPGHL